MLLDSPSYLDRGAEYFAAAADAPSGSGKSVLSPASLSAKLAPLGCATKLRNWQADPPYEC